MYNLFNISQPNQFDPMLIRTKAICSKQVYYNLFKGFSA